MSETRRSQVLINALSDPTYCPYCMRCSGLVRMRRDEPFLWSCRCGAIHDERENAAASSVPSREAGPGTKSGFIGQTWCIRPPADSLDDEIVTAIEVYGSAEYALGEVAIDRFARKAALDAALKARADTKARCVALLAALRSSLHEARADSEQLKQDNAALRHIVATAVGQCQLIVDDASGAVYRANLVLVTAAQQATLMAQDRRAAPLVERCPQCNNSGIVNGSQRCGACDWFAQNCAELDI